MATFTTSATFVELEPNAGYKEIVVGSPSAVTISGDIIQVTLQDHGISKSGFLTINGYFQDTTASIVTTEAPTTAVSAGVLSITVGAGTGFKYYRILGKSN